ncbi:MAG TPA: HAD hydrolase family protein [Candidatus Binatia bacterium]|nr:HAD hydrolase family protein [Candidatus Binatia bacterium]
MRFRVLACDFDGTIATEGVVGPAAVAALRRVAASGRRLILVTGRTRAQLDPLPACLGLFDVLVLENGALLVDLRGGEERLLCAPVSERLLAALRRRGVHPLVAGRAICATHAGNQAAVLGAVREVGLPLGLILNRDQLMILPAGVSKASGARAALHLMGESAAGCVAVGDAENDAALLDCMGCGIAVGDPPAALRAVADLVIGLPDGAAVSELAAHLVGDDLAGVLTGAARKLPSGAPQIRPALS